MTQTPFFNRTTRLKKGLRTQLHVYASTTALLGALLVPSAAHADQGAGTLADPIRIDMFPYAVKGNTALSTSSEIDFYDCAAATNESGPEVVYRFELSQAARVTAWVEGDSATVDIDVQLLDDLTVAGGVANGCLARNNRIAEANMAAGVHYVTVDSYNGAAQAGPFVLRIDAIGDAWNNRQVADGVVWRARRFGNLAGGAQVIHELVIDPTAQGVSVEAIQSNGCQTIAEMASALGAVAAVNGGYFNVNTCAPVSLLKHQGMLLATNGVKRGAFGMDAAGVPLVEVVDAGKDWPTVEEAHGGGPVVAAGTVAKNGPAAWAAEGFADANFIGKNPRTLAGLNAEANILFATVDGRRTNAKGMSLDELAAFSVSNDFGATDAVNLDGGGSTTMWVKNATYNGVVNYPSDDPNQEVQTHPGSRAVSGGFFVFAPPYNHAPRFQTEPPLDGTVGEPYLYDADALDLNVNDTVSFSLDQAPNGMTVDPASGVIEYTPGPDAPALADVTLVASDDAGAASVQAFTLNIVGGSMGSTGGTGGSGGFAGSGGGGFGGVGPGGGDIGEEGGFGGLPVGGEGGGGNGIDGPTGPRRCSCRVPGESDGDYSAAWVGLLLAVGIARRRSPKRIRDLNQTVS
ncbi:MAG: phosphodiester glycosidase family protein [Polyangiaceae bacterium]|nr:phosphodiester glycosidase family protein [Polyangiaceae bacterium]